MRVRPKKSFSLNLPHGIVCSYYKSNSYECSEVSGNFHVKDKYGISVPFDDSLFTEMFVIVKDRGKRKAEPAQIWCEVQCSNCGAYADGRYYKGADTIRKIKRNIADWCYDAELGGNLCPECCKELGR